ncbi:hypothetical protein [Maribacter sp. HTCC2170]|uniref:hypothetical protein n=1 Tax=Maribacter sp. (strain HTCC2170 / KCCM 42371) TaxID=313603 RepID=UPI00006BD5E1|nr:hypothetical protein [Maribacter sp. HTCC2170]EAR02302.1 hypothetical protein FB2170_03425 [Maribacter sp. HTCC2170]
MTKTWAGIFFWQPQETVSQDFNDIFDDIYTETLDELLEEYKASEISYIKAKEIRAKIKENRPLTSEEIKILGLIQI